MLLGGTLTFALNLAGVPAVLTPLAADIVQATGWPLTAVLMSQVTSFFLIFLPYQVAPIFAGLLIGRVRMRHGIRMGLCYTAIYLFIISPLNFFWWRELGMFGS
jgi:fucose permease